MDQNKYIEVRIFEPVAEIPTSDTAHEYSIKTLSTIHECDSAKVPHVQRNLKSNVRNSPFSKQRADSIRADGPLDIDLLLRYYACNSDMEKSINKVFGQIDEHVSKDVDQGGPLVELAAVYKICDSLKNSSKSSLVSTFRYLDVLAKLQSLVRENAHARVPACDEPHRTSRTRQRFFSSSVNKRNEIILRRCVDAATRGWTTFYPRIQH